MKIYIIRHGYTTWNSLGKLQGIQDTELHETGLDQAVTLGERLKNCNISKIYSSPLQRAFKTAEIINTFLNVPIVKDDRLMEMNFGIWQGLTWDEVSNSDKDFFEYWCENRFKTQVPKGESYEFVSNRSFSCIEDIAKTNTDDVLIISHGALIRALFCKILNLSIKDSYTLHIDNCGISIIEYENNNFYIKTINDLGHFQ